MNRHEEDDRRSAESNRISAETGRSVAETGRVGAALGRTATEKKVDGRRRRKDVGQLLAYVLIVGVAMLGFWELQRQDAEACDTSTENRLAIRADIEATAMLGRDLVTEGRDRLSDGQRQALDTLERYRVSQLAKLPLPIC